MPLAIVPLDAVDLSHAVDALGEAVNRLEAATHPSDGHALSLGALESELREGLSMATEVEGQFADLLEEQRRAPRGRAAMLPPFEEPDLSRLAHLTILSTQLRRRLSRVNGRLKHR